jgi:hypothetical protein
VAASRVLVLAHARKANGARRIAQQMRFGTCEGSPTRGNNCCPLRSARRKIEAARDQVLTSSHGVISADAGDFNIRDMLTVAWAFRWKAGLEQALPRWGVAATAGIADTLL